MKRKSSYNDKIFMFFVYLGISFITIACLYPFWDLLVLSLISPNEAFKGGLHIIPKSFDLSAYKQVLASKLIWSAAYNSVWRVVVGTSITVILTTLVSYPLSKRNKFPGYKFWMTYVIITMYFSGGLIPTYLAYRSIGMVDNRLVLVLPGAIAAYNVIMTRNFIRSIPSALEESAKIDGATDFTVWRKIILPLSVPIMATVALWTAVHHWNAYFDVLIYISDRTKYVLQIVLRRMLLEGEVSAFAPPTVEQMDIGDSSRMPTSEQVKAAFTMVCTIPIIMVYPFAQKYFVKGIVVGAVKG